MPPREELRFRLLCLPGWGRAESLRMLFHLAGRPFEETCMSIPEWRRFKSKGLYAESTIEQREIEEIVGYVEAMHEALRPLIRDTLARDTAQRTLHWAQYKQEVLTPVLDYLARTLADRQFFVSDRLTWADVALAEILSRFEKLFDPALFGPHPRLEAHRRRVEGLAQLREHVARRPRTVLG